MSIKIEGAIIGVGMLMLERIPRGLLVKESTLYDQYGPALQEFTDSVKARLGHDFEPPAGFRQCVIDHVMRYLEEKGFLQ